MDLLGSPIASLLSKERASETPFFPGAADALGYLTGRGVKLGVVTSKPWDSTVALLGPLSVDWAAIETPRPGLRGKPAPDHLLRALSDANVDPANAIYVGDMAVDATWGYGAAPEGVLLLTAFHDLLNRIA